jgi:hypothetical protein
MPSALTRRIAALESKRAAAEGGMRVQVLFVPRGIGETAEARWRAENAVPARAAGHHVIAVRFVAPPASRPLP